MTECDHNNVICLNHYELIRKYECADCGAVMMCACDFEQGSKFLPHQLAFGTRLESQAHVPVTAGFVGGVCNECRGQSPEHCPVASSFGRTSKLKRYYWRELAFREHELFESYEGNPENYIFEIGENESELVRRAREQALIDISELHKTNPKYSYSEESNSDFLERTGVSVREVNGEIANSPGRKALIQIGENQLTVEEYAERIYRNDGYEVIHLESMPFHVLFGVFSWMLIQDPDDPLVEHVGFGERSAYERDKSKVPMWIPLPSDFGTDGYADRREKAIARHLGEIQNHRDELLWLFDYWLPYSEGLRQYLWAHREEDVSKARAVVGILDPDAVLAIIGYLIAGYWKRYLGWPDLLVYNQEQYKFVEVKLSRDKLSDEQRAWIEYNMNCMEFPFEIIKIRRVAAQQNHAANRYSATLRNGD